MGYVIAIEVWTFPTDGDEEPCVEEMVECEEFPATLGGQDQAMRFAFQKMEEGFFTRLWRRLSTAGSVPAPAAATDRR